MTNAENDKNTTALKTMVEKLDSRPAATRGYVTNPAELQAILSELSPNVSVNVLENRNAYRKDVSVEIRLAFTLARDEL